jgi:hypothetical protein
MSVFVVLPSSGEGSEVVHQIFQAAALREKGTEQYIDYLEEYGGIDRTELDVSYGIHTPLFTEPTIDKVYKLSLSFSETQKQILMAAGVAVQNEAPQGYRVAKVFTPKP